MFYNWCNAHQSLHLVPRVCFVYISATIEDVRIPNPPFCGQIWSGSAFSRFNLKRYCHQLTSCCLKRSCGCGETYPRYVSSLSCQSFLMIGCLFWWSLIPESQTTVQLSSFQTLPRLSWVHIGSDILMFAEDLGHLAGPHWLYLHDWCSIRPISRISGWDYTYI